MVAATVPTEMDRIRGEVKKHVKKGGWSQKRYQRRRSNEMTGYAREVADVVTRVAEQEGITRIVLLGAKEAMEEITAQLPDRIREHIVGQKGVDLREGDEALGHGLAAFGPAAVLAAARDGRVDTTVVTRDAKIGGVRCRDCEQLTFAKAQQCPACKSNSVFAVDLVNELVELLTLTSATSEFVDPIPRLSAEGDVAALLRY